MCLSSCKIHHRKNNVTCFIHVVFQSALPVGAVSLCWVLVVVSLHKQDENEQYFLTPTYDFVSQIRFDLFLFAELNPQEFRSCTFKGPHRCYYMSLSFVNIGHVGYMNHIHFSPNTFIYEILC